MRFEGEDEESDKVVWICVINVHIRERESRVYITSSSLDSTSKLPYAVIIALIGKVWKAGDCV